VDTPSTGIASPGESSRKKPTPERRAGSPCPVARPA